MSWIKLKIYKCIFYRYKESLITIGKTLKLGGSDYTAIVIEYYAAAADADVIL